MSRPADFQNLDEKVNKITGILYHSKFYLIRTSCVCCIIVCWCTAACLSVVSQGPGSDGGANHGERGQHQYQHKTGPLVEQRSHSVGAAAVGDARRDENCRRLVGRNELVAILQVATRDALSDSWNHRIFEAADVRVCAFRSRRTLLVHHHTPAVSVQDVQCVTIIRSFGTRPVDGETVAHVVVRHILTGVTRDLPDFVGLLVRSVVARASVASETSSDHQPEAEKAALGEMPPPSQRHDILLLTCHSGLD